MALNLWAVGGKPTAYNPLPTGFVNGVSIGICNFTITFNAYSPSGGSFKITQTSGYNSGVVALTPQRQKFTYSGASNSNNPLFIYDNASSGDIVIDGISLVLQPLPKNTINGVDGFLSGKWVIHPNATVIDDNSMILISTVIAQYSSLVVPVIPNTNYIFSAVHNGEISVYNGANSVSIVPWTTNQSVSFNSGANASITINMGDRNLPIGSFLFSNPMLNLGSIQAPYSRKNGDKMTMPTGKNLLPDFRSGKWNLDPVFTVNSANKVTGVFPDTNPYLATCTGIPVTAGATYTVSGNFNTSFGRIRVSKGSDDTIIGGAGSGGITRLAFTVPAGETKINIRVDNNNNSAWVSGTCSWDSLQLEAGGVQTSFKPYYMKVNPKPSRVVSANKGMAFNGSTDLIDMGSNNLGITNNIVLDVDFFVTGYSGAGAFIFGKESEFKLDVINSQSAIRFLTGENWVGSILQVSILPNQRNTVKAVYDGTNKYIYVNGALAASIATSGNIPYVSTTFLTIGARKSAGGASTSDYAQGAIYSAKLTINGVVAANYDLTEQNNFVGNQVIPGARNLLPSFDDPRWVLANASNGQILGKNALHFGGNNSYTSPIINVVPNTNYLLTCSFGMDANHRLRLLESDGVTMFGAATPAAPFLNFNSGSRTQIIVRPETNGQNGPSYDFIRPQLYQLTGLEGTINGIPVQKNKASKRNLYAKR